MYDYTYSVTGAKCFLLAAEHKKLICRREAARCFVSLNVLLSHSMNVIEKVPDEVRFPIPK